MEYLYLERPLREFVKQTLGVNSPKNGKQNVLRFTPEKAILTTERLIVMRLSVRSVRQLRLNTVEVCTIGGMSIEGLQTQIAYSANEKDPLSAGAFLSRKPDLLLLDLVAR